MKNTDRTNTEDKLAKLISEYMPKIRKRAARFDVRSLGLEREDLELEGMLGLFRASESFDDSRATSFSTYAGTCIDNAMTSALTKAARRKHLPLNDSVSFDGEIVPTVCSPEDSAIASELHVALSAIIASELSQLERDVLSLYLRGYDYLDAARLLGRTAKTTDNALQRARKKLEKRISGM
ncbi:MAG: sigma-70 family RNA polymerase sigma factor [Oscillospiraceae bacterium]